jgi:hypothetical protein
MLGRLRTFDRSLTSRTSSTIISLIAASGGQQQNITITLLQCVSKSLKPIVPLSHVLSNHEYSLNQWFADEYTTAAPHQNLSRGNSPKGCH